MNKGTVKYFYLSLPYFLVFITKLQNPKRNITFLISSWCFSQMPIVPCSQGLTNIYSVCLHEIRGFNKWKKYINILAVSHLANWWQREDSRPLEFKLWVYFSKPQLPRDHICDWSQLLEWLKLRLLLPTRLTKPASRKQCASLAATWHSLSELDLRNENYHRGCQRKDISCLSHRITSSPAGPPPLCTSSSISFRPFHSFTLLSLDIKRENKSSSQQT